MGEYYEPNKIQWKVGDIVLLEYDAKEPRFLVKIIRIDDNELIVGKYLDFEIRKSYPRFCSESIENAHDPAKFAVPIQPSAWPTWYEAHYKNEIYYYEKTEREHGFKSWDKLTPEEKETRRQSRTPTSGANP